MQPDDNMLPPDNPLRNYSDPFADMRKNMQKHLLDNPTLTNFERLCYEVFIMDKQGRDLYELLQKKYLLTSRIHPEHPQAGQMALYEEGFKSAIRGLMDSATRHLERINHVSKGA